MYTFNNVIYSTSNAFEQNMNLSVILNRVDWRVKKNIKP